MPTRRSFLKQTLGGSAAFATGFLPSRVLGANDRIRIGLVGGGDRGQEIFKAALACATLRALRSRTSTPAASMK
jgi:hypothetical protein